MSRVALAACVPLDLDPDAPLLVAALAAAGIDGAVVAWDDERVDWRDFDLVVVRSTWDYPRRRDGFLAWARAIPKLCNPYEALEYSSDKHYLLDLAAKGVDIIPSRFCDVGSSPVFFEGDVVVKPCVGAGSLDAARYGPGDLDAAREHVAALHTRGRDALLQPYVASVDERGERAVIFVDGAYSHAMTKGPLLNVAEGARDWFFRREQMSRVEPEPAARRAAEGVLEAAGFADLLYARVDLALEGATWQVMELELVEPSLFLTYEPAVASVLAEAIARRVATR